MAVAEKHLYLTLTGELWGVCCQNLGGKIIALQQYTGLNP